MNDTVTVLSDFDMSIRNRLFARFDADLIESFYLDEIYVEGDKQQAIVDFVKAVDWVQTGRNDNVEIVVPNPPMLELNKMLTSEYAISKILIYGVYFVLLDVPSSLLYSAEILYTTRTHPAVLAQMLKDGMDVGLILDTHNENQG